MSRKIINGLGFKYDEVMEVKGRLSISDLFPKSKKRCGIYLLNFSDDTFYIGQAIDAVRRFSQHRKKYDSIVRFWFIPLKKPDLNEIEERLIKKAEAQGLLVTNKTHVSSVIGETDLDMVITPKEQELWLENNKPISNEGFDLYPTIELKFKIKHKHNYEKLKENEDYPQIKRILKKYIKKCIPAYKKTELSFWSLSCMPSTNSGSYPRYFCININAMEVFVLGYAKKEKKYLCFINTTKRFLKGVTDFKKLAEGLNKYDGSTRKETNYRAAGGDQFQFHFDDLDVFEKFFDKEIRIIESVKEMNLRLMKKGGTIYSPSHCFELANDVLK